MNGVLGVPDIFLLLVTLSTSHLSGLNDINHVFSQAWRRMRSSLRIQQRDDFRCYTRKRRGPRTTSLDVLLAFPSRMKL